MNFVGEFKGLSLAPMIKALALVLIFIYMITGVIVKGIKLGF